MTFRSLFNLGYKRHIDLSRDLLKSILTLGAVIEARDAYTGGHTWRVSKYSRMLAEYIGLSASEVFLVELGGFIHDIGKVGIPDHVLNKPGSLTEDEYALLKTHPGVGNALLKDHPLGPLVLDAITHHHERLDGKGYPAAIRSDTLSIYPRIIAVADCFDAMTSTRPYRKGLAIDVAMGIMSELRGIQFEGFLVEALCDLITKNRLGYILGHSNAGRRLAICPMDGPIMAVPSDKKNGDMIYCHACKGMYRLHIAADTFELESTGQRRFDLQPEIDADPINTMASAAPRRITLGGR